MTDNIFNHIPEKGIKIHEAITMRNYVLAIIVRMCSIMNWRCLPKIN